MKLVRYGQSGKEKPGLIDSDGVLRSLSHQIDDCDGWILSAAAIKRRRKIKTDPLAN